MGEMASIHSLNAFKEAFKKKYNKEFNPSPEEYLISEIRDNGDMWIYLALNTASKDLVREQNKQRMEGKETLLDVVASWENQDNEKAAEYAKTKEKEISSEVEAQFREKFMKEMLEKQKSEIDKEVERRLAEEKAKFSLSVSGVTVSEEDAVKGSPVVAKKMGRPKGSKNKVTAEA